MLPEQQTHGNTQRGTTTGEQEVPLLSMTSFMWGKAKEVLFFLLIPLLCRTKSKLLERRM